MSKPARYALFALPLIFFLGLALLFFTRIGKDPSELPAARLGQPMPAFSLSELKNPQQLISAQDLKGQVLLFNVWATWCVSCLVEHPVLMQLAGEGVPIVGMNYKDNREAARQYLVNQGDPFRFTIFDEAGDLGLDLGVYGAPETYLIDPQGRIRYRLTGVLDAQKWQQELKPRYEALLKEVASGEGA